MSTNSPNKWVTNDGGAYDGKTGVTCAFYNAGAPHDDARVEIVYRTDSTPSRGTVHAIFYHGDSQHAPPGLPYIEGLTGEQLYDRFKSPSWSSVPDNDNEYEMFADGLTAELWHRTVTKYGIQDFYLSE